MNRSQTWVMTDAVLVGGDSGGPLFDLDGKLVGIHSRIGNSTSANMHVPIDKFTNDWARLAAGEEWNELGDAIARAGAPTPWLGIDVESTGADQGLPVGLRVTVVEQTGPAAAAGLMAGDVITRFNSRPVEDRDDLTDRIARLRVGDTARLEIVRDGGESATLRVKLGRRPEASGR
jgi:serine protease Do